MPSGSVLYQDSGFQGFTLPGINIIQPQNKPRGENSLLKKKRIATLRLGRIRVEHAIAGIKKYRIVQDRLRNWKKGSVI